MINKEFLDFKVLVKPEKDLFKTIQSNAKFTELSQIVKTKVGINNFYNFSIAFKSSIIFRDIVLNCPYVSGWARSTQVLNDTDSKFNSYRFLTMTEADNDRWIDIMKLLENSGHTMDNMRCLIRLDSITDYAINTDLLHLIYLTLILNKMQMNLENNSKLLDLREEILYFKIKLDELLSESFDIDFLDYTSMLTDAQREFNAIETDIAGYRFEDATKEKVFDINSTYSVVGQMFRHRTLNKAYALDTYEKLLGASIFLTKNYDYSLIEVHPEISRLIKDYTCNADNIYKLVQGSIVPIVISGTTGAIYKALCQRTCYINDTPHFKDALNDFIKENPSLMLTPPCKFNGKNCYVSYVNSSRMKGEEFTQIPCPIWCKANGYNDAFIKASKTQKTEWYKNNLIIWSKACEVNDVEE